MSQLGRTRLQTKRAREQNESAEAEVSMNADMFASLRACDCVAAAGHLCDKDHQYLREFSLLAANFADSSENKSAHLVSHGDEWLALKCVTIDNNDDDDAKGNQEWNANKKLASLLEQSVCGGFAAPVAYMCERKSRRVKRWFLFGFAGASLSFVNALIPLFQVATIGQIRTAEDHVRLLRVQRSLRRERAILTIYCKYDVDNAVVSVNERNQIVDALCGMPELESARTFVRSAFDAARALASDERVARGAILQIVYSLVCAEEQHQLVHDDLHANNICLQPCGVWQVLFDDDQVAFLFRDVGNCYSVMTPIAKLLGSMSLLYDFSESRLCADNMASLWAKLTALDDFAALGAHWREERPADFVVEGALFFSRDGAACGTRRDHLIDLCRTERQ